MEKKQSGKVQGGENTEGQVIGGTAASGGANKIRFFSLNQEQQS